MRLSRIKIAGFKSFVDPTDIKLPSQLVGIVGPNGCGKSNTIDAVRWVMGESSAKHLRGESMDDVIFVGSSTRKPVGHASVELVFDNSDGSLGGEYSQYAEISIRREVSRDGQSKYALNNVRCRRRDIRDIFLGTGLGPRSYAIIEQGMISRLIEAKPEELRVYLEEAAGISKYKERRKETETRIRHTRDNLDRLDDLREEVDKQLAHLKRQASTAERYQRLKGEERQKRGELLVLRRLDFEKSRDQQSLKTSELEKELEAIIAELRAAESSIELARAQQTEASESFSTVQAEFYRIGGEVARIEQTIEHTRETRHQQSRELADVDKSLEESLTHLRDDTARIAEIAETLENDQPAFDLLKDSQKHSAELLLRAEAELQEWQTRNDTFNRRFSDVSQTAQVERSRIEQFERSLANADTRLNRLREERQSLDLTPFHEKIEMALEQQMEASEEEERLQESLSHASEKQQIQKESIRQRSEQLDQARSRVQSGLGRLASLEALQQAALEPDSNVKDSWLHTHDLQDLPRLAQSITADAGWERAVELVLGPHLEAVCVDGDQIIERCLQDMPAAQLTLVNAAANDGGTPASSMLASKVQGSVPLSDLLAGIHAAQDLNEALRIRASLGPGETVVTPDGLWMGASWLRVARGEAQDSVLLRATEITELKAELAELDIRAAQLTDELAELSQQQDELETRRETQLHAFNDAVRNHSQVSSAIAADRQRLEQGERRTRTLDEELAEIEQAREQEVLQLEDAAERKLEAVEQLEELEQEKARISEEHELLRATLSQAREQRDADRDAGQELAIRVESMRSARVATEKNLTRMQERIRQLSERQSALNSMLTSEDDGEDPLVALEAGLQQHLAGKLASDNAMRTAREQLDSIEHRLREHEQARQRHDTRAQSMREKVQSERMAAQEVLVRLKTLDEQLAEHDYKVMDILESLTEEANIQDWATELERLERQIQRLGPINLAAIDELAEQSERKQYLDDQHQDVTEALATLERAIAKIDRETRSRFKDTFDKVNAKVEEFFPRLFGGGHGSLQMTGDDLLSTGVSVNAQPPGKRVSNIQLLSGGEKALTAVALVFAFFELNPSPFCMLDEVDAPLDDANVGRFCELVKEMSERVQFIFITHNKVTMEMAQQLMGVTMNEPGVSRLVTVDVHEAAEMVGA
ncbi:chromosome segregation protein SMC [Granulosicoccus antarcticus]|uniref:Chromosome partition protein Smc n=1 Tax=Granulosicoccus antarcticus IMCC3135 TaxID=1192854 RepID=A0A2Z2NTS4_9GAMM|nr:chromosome segregation protein SMC [Granulosicoccus antarcticus]ASJ74876.1 Chromosome partition protein Smc [Granulosicoccus antarcticus IMCC3135]